MNGCEIKGAAIAYRLVNSFGAANVTSRLFSFVGGMKGNYAVVDMKTLAGEPLPLVDRLAIINGVVESKPDSGTWVLRGVTSNERYATRSEKSALAQIQAPLGRPGSTQAA